jgi:predicted AAA+ superfamily ATPase
MERIYSDEFAEFLQYFPCIAIIGARQCGKTTLAKLVGKDWPYFDMERMADRSMIAQDPDLFLSLNPNHIVIDEAQELPALFPALRVAIDADRGRNGRFILTGSSSPELLTSISESLAGRIAVIHLSPLAFCEIHQPKQAMLCRLLTEGASLERIETELKPRGTLQDAHQYWLRGGYPEPWIKNSPRYWQLWMDNYFDTYVARDVARHFPRLDLVRYKQLIASLASVSGTVINYSDLARNLDVTQKTIKEYLQIAHGTFLWRNIPAYTPHSLKRLVKHPKGYIRDSGLVHYLLRTTSLDQLLVHPQMGHSWESMVIEQILRQFDMIGERVEPSYYRTCAGAEVDLVLQGTFGVIPIEIKHTQAVRSKQILGIRNFLDEFPCPYGLVIHNDIRITRIDKDILGIPMSWL